MKITGTQVAMVCCGVGVIASILAIILKLNNNTPVSVEDIFIVGVTFMGLILVAKDKKSESNK